MQSAIFHFAACGLALGEHSNSEKCDRHHCPDEANSSGWQPFVYSSWG
jgi:hypothetical protein